jgi:hypothetical protein
MAVGKRDHPPAGSELSVGRAEAPGHDRKPAPAAQPPLPYAAAPLPQTNPAVAPVPANSGTT